MEIFLGHLESPACHCLGRWRHAVGFVPRPVHPHLGEAYYPHPHDDAKVLCDINHTSTTPPVRTLLAHFHSLVMGIIVHLLHKKNSNWKNPSRVIGMGAVIQRLALKVWVGGWVVSSLHPAAISSAERGDHDRESPLPCPPNPPSDTLSFIPLLTYTTYVTYDL